MQHIPYRGSAPALQALLSGEIDVVFDALPPTMGQIKAGKLRAWASPWPSARRRCPTSRPSGEQGIAGVEAYTWAGLYAPAGTAPAIVNRLNAELLKSLKDPENARKISELGYELAPVDAGRTGGPHGGGTEEVDRGGEGRRREARLNGLAGGSHRRYREWSVEI